MRSDYTAILLPSFPSWELRKEFAEGDSHNAHPGFKCIYSAFNSIDSCTHTLNNSLPFSGFVLFTGRWLLRNVFTATLWDRHKYICKRPILCNFLSHLNFSYFWSLFLLWEGVSVLTPLEENLTPGRGKKPFLLPTLSFSVKWSYDVQTAETAIAWRAPKPHGLPGIEP